MRNKIVDDCKFKIGFTIIELIVVIAIISVLASIVLVNVNGYIAKARDARRKVDLSSINKAFIIYYVKMGNYMVTGSGCGYGGNGNGWFNYSGGSYPISMAQCLVNAGAVSTEIIDPTGGRTSTPTARYTYMKYSCGNPIKTYIYAKLATIPQSSTATDGTCCSTCDSSYGMNYYIQF